MSTLDAATQRFLAQYSDAAEALDGGDLRGSWHGSFSEQRQQLDAETQRHYAAARTHRALVKAAVLALLPLATDEPADLIEWAAALGAGS